MNLFLSSLSLKAQSATANSITIKSIKNVDKNSRDINNVTTLLFDIQPDVVFDKGGKLTIIFPPSFSFNDSLFKCQVLLGLKISNADGSYSCERQQNVVYTKGLYYSDKSIYIWIRIFGVVNPPNTLETSSFQAQTFNEQGQIICQSFQQLTYAATPGILKLPAGITRTNRVVGDNTTIRFQIQIQNKIQANSWILISFPSSAATLIPSALQCNKVDGGVLQTIECKINSTSDQTNSFLIKETCSQFSDFCQPLSLMYFEILGVRNPDFNAVSKSGQVVVTTLTQTLDAIYDTVAVNNSITPSLIPATIDFIQINKTGTIYLGDNVYYDIKINVTNYFMKNDGIIKIFMPMNLVQLNPDIQLETQLFFQNLGFVKKLSNYTVYDEAPLSIKQLNIYLLCSSICSSSQLYIKILNIRNQAILGFVPDPYFGFQMETIQGYLISIQNYSFPLQAFFSQKINPSPIINIEKSIVGTISQYSITFTPSVEIYNDIQNQNNKGFIQIQLPNEIQMTLQSNCIASVTLASNQSKMIMNCILDKVIGQINITHQLQPQILRKNLVTILISNVMNPDSVKPTSLMEIKTYANNQVQEFFQTILTVSSPNQLFDIVIQRSSIFMNSDIELNITFKTPTKIPKNAIIRIFLPLDQISFLNLIQPNMNVIGILPSFMQMNYQQVVNQIDYYGLEFYESRCPCNINQTLSYKILGSMNPNHAKLPNNSFRFVVKTPDDFLISQNQNGLFASPNVTSGKISIDFITSINRTTGEITALDFQINLQNSMDKNGILIIEFPDELFFSSVQTDNIQCSRKTQDFSMTEIYCTQVLKQNQLTKFVKQIKIINLCPVKCLPYSQYRFIVSQLQNTYMVNSYFKDSLNLQTFQQDGYLVDEGLFSSKDLMPNITNTIKSIQIIKSTSIIDSPLDLQVSIQNKNLIPKNSKIIMKISTDLMDFNQQGLSKCIRSDNQQDLNCQLIYIDFKTFQVTLTEFCASAYKYCLPLQYLNFRITNLQNPMFIAQSHSNIIIQIYDSNFNPIEQSQSLPTPSLEINKITDLQILLQDKRVSVENKFILSFTLPSRVPSQSMILLNFSSKFIQFQKKTCFIKIDRTYNEIQCELTTESNFIQQVTLFNPCQEICSKGSVFKIEIDVLNQLYVQAHQGLLTITILNMNNLLISSGSKELTTADPLSVYLLTQQDLKVTRQRTEPGIPTPYIFEIIFPTVLIYGATIQIYIPRQQVELTTIMIKCVMIVPIEGAPLGCKIISGTSDYYLMQIQQNFCIIFCDAYFHLKFKILETINLSTAKYQPNQFYLEAFYQNDKQMIYQTIDKVDANPQISLPPIYDVKIIRTYDRLESPSNLHLQFTIPSNITNNHQIQFKFPRSLIYKKETYVVQMMDPSFQNYTKNLTVVQILTKDDGYAKFYTYSILLKNICETICVEGTKYYIKITGGWNPFFIPIPNDDDEVIINVILNQQIVFYGTYDMKMIQPSLKEQQIIIKSAVRSNQVPNMPTNISFSFVNPMFIVYKSYIVITIPFSQLIPVQKYPKLSRLNGLEIEYKQLLKSNSSIQLSFFEYCSLNQDGCSTQTLTTIIQGFINPSIQVNGESIQIDIYTYKNEKTMSAFTGFYVTPLLTQQKISNIVVQRGSQKVGELTEINFNFVLMQNFEDSVTFTINMPTDIAFNPTKCYYIKEKIYRYEYNCLYTLQENQSVTKIIFQNMCDGVFFKCRMNTEISLVIQIKNPPFAVDYIDLNQIIQIIASSQNQIASGQFSIEILPLIQPNIISDILITLNNQTVNAFPVDMKIEFKITNHFQTLDQFGWMLISLPSDIVKDQKIQNCKAFMEIEKTVFDISCDYNYGQKLQVFHQKSIIDISQARFTININGVMNPPDTRTLMIHVATYNIIKNKQFKIDEGQLYYQASQLQNQMFSQISLQRSNIIRNSAVIMQISFTILKDMSEYQKFFFDIQTSLQLDFELNNQLICKSETNKEIVCLRYNTGIIFDQQYCGGSCLKNQKIQLTIQGFKNPLFVKPILDIQDSFGLYITPPYNINFYVDGINRNLVFNPKSVSTQLQLIRLNSSNNIVNQDTEIIFQIKLANLLDKQMSNVIIKFAKFQFQAESNNTLKCYVQQQLSSCYFIKKTEGSLSYVDTLVFNNVCEKISNCSYLLEFSIQKIRNSKFRIDLSKEYFNIQSTTFDFRNYFQPIDYFSSKTSDYFKPLESGSIDYFTISSKNPVVNQKIDITFTFQTSNVFYAGSSVYVIFPESFKIQDFVRDDKICEKVLGFNKDLSCESWSNTLIVSNGAFQDIPPCTFQFTIKEVTSVKIPKIIYGFQLQTKYDNRIMDSTNKGASLQIYEYLQNPCLNKNCKSCSKDGKCFECENPSINPIFFNQNCVSSCSQGFYLQKTTLNCEKCFNTCYECSGLNENQCITCQNGYFFDSGYCVKECPRNTFLNQTFCQEKDSFQCDLSCISCGSISNYCYECQQGYKFDPVTKLCQQLFVPCSDGFYLSNNICKACNNDCISCIQQDVCSQCKTYFGKPFLTPDMQCSSSCPNTHYSNEADNVCMLCNQDCQTCFGSSNSQCISCNKNSNKKYLSYGQCVDKCPVGQLLTNDVCLKNCTNNCYDCDITNKDKCLQCYGKYQNLLSNNCLEKCPDGYYQFLNKTLNQYICKPCSQENCKSCPSDVCQQCMNPLNTANYSLTSKNYFFWNKCIDICPSGYSPDYTNPLKCMHHYCLSPCSKCGITEDFCYECDAQHKNSYKNYCYNGCPLSTVQKNQSFECLDCLNQCRTCQSVGLCTSCTRPLILRNTNCVDSCEFHETYDEHNNRCYQRQLDNFIYIPYCILGLSILGLIWILVSYQKVDFLSALEFIFCIIQFLSRVQQIFYYYMIDQPISAGLNGAIWISNFGLSMIFSEYYLGLMELHIPTYKQIINQNPNFYQNSKIIMLIFGPSYAKIFSAGLLFLPKLDFSLNPLYKKTLRIMIEWSNVVTVFQIFLNLFTLVDSLEYTQLRAALFDLIINICQIGSALYIRFQESQSIKYEKVN